MAQNQGDEYIKQEMDNIAKRYAQECYDLMMERFDDEVSTFNALSWERLSEDYRSRTRLYPDKPILVQDGDLKNSIEVEFGRSLINKSFFYPSGSDNAMRHNKGYTYTTRTSTNYGTTMGKTRKITVPARPCMEIPLEYRLGGKEMNFMLDEVNDKVDELIDAGY